MLGRFFWLLSLLRFFDFLPVLHFEVLVLLLIFLILLIFFIPLLLILSVFSCFSRLYYFFYIPNFLFSILFLKCLISERLNLHFLFLKSRVICKWGLTVWGWTFWCEVVGVVGRRSSTFKTIICWLLFKLQFSRPRNFVALCLWILLTWIVIL